MNSLTPQNIVNNLYKKFPEIIGHAILGYYKFFKIEQELISMIDTNIEPQIINTFIIWANIIQYGKTYFLQEIISNLIQNEMFFMYIGLFNPMSEKVTQLTGGGKVNEQILMLFMVLMFIINLNNVTSVSNAISPLGDITVINIAEGVIPEATSNINRELNPHNLTELLEFTTQYALNPIIPSDKTFTTNVNIYKDQFIEITKKSMPFFEKVFTSDTAFNELFIKEIKRKTDDINSLSFNVSNVLNEVCIGFSEVINDDLPITLYNLFNKKLKEKTELLKQKQKIIIEKEEERLKEQLLTDYGIPLEGESSFSISNIGKMFSFNYKKKEPSPEKINIPQSELNKVIDNVEQIVKDEMILFTKKTDIILIEEASADVMQDMIKNNNQNIQITNLKKYLTAICKIKIPQYKFNETTGELYIKDIPISRFHLKILATNVQLNYNTVMKLGIKEENQEKMKSLYEKSDAILQIFTNYDVGIYHIFDPDVTPNKMDDFFNNIANLWLSLKNNMENALLQFPITEMETTNKIKQEKQELIRELNEQQAKHDIEIKKKQAKHDIDVKTKQQDIIQTSELNNISSQSWDLLRETLKINTKGSVGVVTDALSEATNTIINSTSGVIDNVLDRSVNSVLSIAYGISQLGYIFMVPLAMALALTTGFIAVRTGYVHRLFAPNHKSIQNAQLNNQNINRRPTRWGPPLSEEQIRINLQQSIQNKPNRWGPPLSEEQIRINQEQIFRNNLGGKLIYNKKRKNKTRKNKRHKTKKIKVKNKRRHTRHKNGVKSKRR
jgi:hypothetical protein